MESTIRYSCLAFCLILLLPYSPLPADTVILVDGQELDGIVTGVTDTQITLEKQGESIVVSKKLVSLIFLGSGYHNASPKKRQEMRRAKEASTSTEAAIYEKTASTDPMKQGDESNQVGTSYLWIQVGPADATDFARPVINRVRNYSLLTDFFPTLLATDELGGNPVFANLGFFSPISGGLYMELQSSGYRINKSTPQIGSELDIMNSGGTYFNLVTGSMDFRRHDRFYFDATLGKQWALGESGWIVEPRISAGYSGYDVVVLSTFAGISPLATSLFFAKDDISLSGEWPGFGLGMKLRYLAHTGASEYYVLLVGNRTQGSFGLDIARYSAGGLLGNGYRGADFHFTGYSIIAELGFLYRIATNWQFMVSINARKERFQVNGSYYYATTPPTSSIEPLLPFLYAQAPHIPEFTEQSYAVALGLRLYIW